MKDGSFRIRICEKTGVEKTRQSWSTWRRNNENIQHMTNFAHKNVKIGCAGAQYHKEELMQNLMVRSILRGG